ncbi:hypothetical protein AZE42_03252 [Rhizopogon vesiculosus]|uniref:Methyltransferase domain-containing protein n=1 Tax=Rhizopogon vesiculosus TaxID=180088 RepID=A0A1J8RI97_9AGAM|nr:hypothetical protein AZE42_03252 [Rhizopogon vesiculosus]
MSLPHKNEEYGTEAYWDTRYEQEADDTSFDWFKTYADVADYIRRLIPSKDARILMLGCGNSKFSEDVGLSFGYGGPVANTTDQMWEDGYKCIVNVDYSPIVIEKMSNRHKDRRPEMTWEVKDVRTLDGLDSSSFDIAIDKGTMDAMMTSSPDVWDPPEQVIKDCTAEVSQVLRVLKQDGIFIYITFGQPHFRKQYLTVQHHEHFYFTLVTFLVEDCLFRVPYHALASQSDVFRDLALLPVAAHKAEGHSDTDPIVLEGIKKEDFQSLMKVLYPMPVTRLPSDGLPATIEEWTSVLKLSKMWGFNCIHEFAIKQLEPMLAERPLDKVALAQDYGVTRWLLPGLLELATRAEPVGSEDVQRLGLDTALKLADVRESRQTTTVPVNWSRTSRSVLGFDYQAETTVVTASGLGALLHAILPTESATYLN